MTKHILAKILHKIILVSLLGSLAACGNTEMEEVQCTLYDDCPDNEKSVLCSWYGNCGEEGGGGGGAQSRKTTYNPSGQGISDVDHSGDSHY